MRPRADRLEIPGRASERGVATPPIGGSETAAPDVVSIVAAIGSRVASTIAPRSDADAARRRVVVTPMTLVTGVLLQIRERQAPQLELDLLVELGPRLEVADRGEDQAHGSDAEGRGRR